MLLIVIPLISLLLSYFLTISLPFFKPVSEVVISGFIIDFIQNSAVWILFYILYSKRIKNNIKYLIDISFKDFLSRYNFLIYILIFGILINVMMRLGVILSGTSREALVFELGRNRFMMIAPTIVTYLSVISILGNYKNNIKIPLILGVLLSSIYMLSRTELLNYIYLLLITAYLYGVLFKKISKFFVFFISIIILSSILTILQGRQFNLIDSIYSTIESLFRYGAYSFYLPEYLFKYFHFDVETVLFPFFGFFYERLISIFSELNYPISTQGSMFVSEFHYLGLGNNFSANVLYPWWAWFFAVFGYFGFILKGIYTFFLMYIFLKLKFTFTLLFIINFIIVFQIKLHPFINSDSVYVFLAVLIMDIIVYFYNKKHAI